MSNCTNTYNHTHIHTYTLNIRTSSGCADDNCISVELLGQQQPCNIATGVADQNFGWRQQLTMKPKLRRESQETQS